MLTPYFLIKDFSVAYDEYLIARTLFVFATLK